MLFLMTAAMCNNFTNRVSYNISKTRGFLQARVGGGGGDFSGGYPVKSHTGRFNLLPFHRPTFTENKLSPLPSNTAASIILCLVISMRNSAQFLLIFLMLECNCYIVSSQYILAAKIKFRPPSEGENGTHFGQSLPGIRPPGGLTTTKRRYRDSFH